MSSLDFLYLERIHSVFHIFFLYPFEMFMHFVWPKCWVHDDAVVPCFVFRIIRVLTRKWMELLTHGQSHLFSDLSEIGYLTQCVVDYWTQYWNIKLFSLICVLCAVNSVSFFFFKWSLILILWNSIHLSFFIEISSKYFAQKNRHEYKLKW